MKLDGIDERFIVRGRMEILDILNDLIYRTEPVVLSCDDEANSFRVTLLEARDKTLVFEAGGDPAAWQRILGATRCVFAARPDGIQVRFATATAIETSWDGSKVLMVPLPERIARLQRQESLRVLVPPRQKLTARLLDANGKVLGEFPVRDLSTGGLGVAARGHPRPEIVQRIARVATSLPGHGEIDCAVTLRHVTWLSGGEKDPPSRIGLSFVGLPPAMRAAIQRYILATANQNAATGETSKHA
jgi:c-di-GMP-binding flagellar brake protein YcgR